jgi:hypothetical protein
VKSAGGSGGGLEDFAGAGFCGQQLGKGEGTKAEPRRLQELATGLGTQRSGERARAATRLAIRGHR